MPAVDGDPTTVARLSHATYRGRLEGWLQNLRILDDAAHRHPSPRTILAALVYVAELEERDETIHLLYPEGREIVLESESHATRFDLHGKAHTVTR